MTKSLVLVSILCGVLANCGGGSGGPSSNSSPTLIPQNIDIDAKLKGQTIEFKDETVKLSTKNADEFNAKRSDLETISYINTVKGTDKRFYIDSGIFLQNFLVENGTSILGNATIKGDFINHSGAVIINTDYNTTIEGKFESTGHSLLTKHRNPTNGMRVVNVGTKSLKVGSAVFDGSDIKSDGTFGVGGTEFNVVLTDNISGDYKSKAPVIDAQETVQFSLDKTTIINFEKLNKAVIKAGSTHALVKAKKVDVSTDKFLVEYRFSSTSIPGVEAAENGSIELIKETNGAWEYLIMKVVKDISGKSSPYLGRHHQHALNLVADGSRKHHFNHHTFNVNIQTLSFGSNFDMNVHDSGNGFGISRKNKDSLFQAYASFDESSKNAHLYKDLSFNGVIFSGQAGFYLEKSLKENSGSAYANIALHKPFSHSGMTISPKISFDYMRDLNSVYSLSDQDGAGIVSFKTSNAFALTPGIEGISTFSIKGVPMETALSLEYTHGLNNKEVTIDSQNYNIVQDRLNLDVHMKAALDAHTNLYAAYGINIHEQIPSSSFSFGVGVKI